MLLLVQVLIVTLCVGVTTLVAVRVQHDLLHTATVERVTAVAQSLAELPAVTDAIVAAEGGGVPARQTATAALQPVAELVRQASAVDYVVITDAAGIRFTHPNPAAHGQQVSTDASAVLRGETFVGVEQGTLGLTLRTKVPVYSGDAVIGTVSVGLLQSHGESDLDDGLAQLAPWVLASLLVGSLAAALVDRVLSRRLARLEADSRELEVQRRLAVELRSQTHEFANRMHVVFGLVDGGDSDDALRYIGSIVPVLGLDTTESVPGGTLHDARLRAALGAPGRALRAHGGELRLHADSVAAAHSSDDDQVTVTANLLANAVDAATDRADRPDRPDRPARVDVTVRSDATGFSLVVCDNGPGLDPELRRRVFDRGFSTKRLERRGGIDIPRGVGLALVRDTVRRRGGTVSVGSAELGGARFHVTLPARDGEA